MMIFTFYYAVHVDFVYTSNTFTAVFVITRLVSKSHAILWFSIAFKLVGGLRITPTFTIELKTEMVVSFSTWLLGTVASQSKEDYRNIANIVSQLIIEGFICTKHSFITFKTICLQETQDVKWAISSYRQGDRQQRRREIYYEIKRPMQ